MGGASGGALADMRWIWEVCGLGSWTSPDALACRECVDIFRRRICGIGRMGLGLRVVSCMRQEEAIIESGHQGVLLPFCWVSFHSMWCYCEGDKKINDVIGLPHLDLIPPNQEESVIWLGLRKSWYSSGANFDIASGRLRGNNNNPTHEMSSRMYRHRWICHERHSG